MLPAFARTYLKHGLAASPHVVEGLLGRLAPEDPAWDRRPDIQRFTLREMVAHLADWEPIWLERLTRTTGEDEPSLPGYDEGQLAIDHDYAHSDPIANLARFRAGRSAVVAFVDGLGEEQWARAAQREGLGRVTTEAQLVMIVGHDGYHLREAAEWLSPG